jgi:hypothetical protein
MPPKSIGLFNAWSAEAKTDKEHHRHINNVLAYCASRFRSALPALTEHPDKRDEERTEWMQECLFMELVGIFIWSDARLIENFRNLPCHM